MGFVGGSIYEFQGLKCKIIPVAKSWKEEKSCKEQKGPSRSFRKLHHRTQFRSPNPNFFKSTIEPDDLSDFSDHEMRDFRIQAVLFLDLYFFLHRRRTLRTSTTRTMKLSKHTRLQTNKAADVLHAGCLFEEAGILAVSEQFHACFQVASFAALMPAVRIDDGNRREESKKNHEMRSCVEIGHYTWFSGKSMTLRKPLRISAGCNGLAPP